MRRTSARSDGRLGPRLAVVAASVAVLVATAVPMLAQAAPTGAEESWPEPTVVGELGRGDALFWDVPYLESVGTGTRQTDEALCLGPVTTYPTCAVGADPLLVPTGPVADVTTHVVGENPFCGNEHACFAYSFDVTERGDVLRVALDQPSLRDLVFVYLYDPSGALVAKMNKFNAGEAWVRSPAVGRWVARVHVSDARDTSFRMRAALDPDDGRRGPAGTPAAEKKSGFLLPNLQVVPPYELGFGPCQTTEVVDYNAQRCLRFSTGPANVGDGPLDLVVSDTGSLEGPMQQRLHKPDGSTETVAAGSYEYHPEHVHYHHGALQSLELLRVTDSRHGTLEPAGSGPKIGFCLAPFHIAEWDTFAQDAPFSVYQDDACGSADPPIPTQMALARGWIDPYPWWVDGNFVDFGDNADGEYVIRVASDPDGDIRETLDGDNHAYTYIRVTGDEIEVLERGRGASPWDPRRVVVDDTRPPIRWTE